MIVYVYVCTVCVYESVCFTNVYLRRIQVDILLLTYVVCLIMRRKINIYLILSYLIEGPPKGQVILHWERNKLRCSQNPASKASNEQRTID